MCTDQTSIYTFIRESFGGIESEPMLIPKGKSPYRRLREVSTPQSYITQNSEPNILPTELIRPRSLGMLQISVSM